MTEKIIYIIYKESLLQSIVSDITTFGFILICIWASQGSKWWTFLTTVMLLFFIVVQIQKFTGSDSRLRFYSIEQLSEWVDKQEREQ